MHFNMILHHYPLSPYSEMIRLMLGYTSQRWHSVVTTPAPPRRHLDILTGGYRRIPVAQIGADVFCDTQLIAEEISHFTRDKRLSFVHSSAEEKEFIRTLRERYFMSIVQSASPAKTLFTVSTALWPWQLPGLLADRASVAKSSKLPRMSASEHQKITVQLKEELNLRLSHSDFLFGGVPCLADFAAYHLIWFALKTQPPGHLRKFHLLNDWQTRMSQYGHGQRIKKSADYALETALQASPRSIDTHSSVHAQLGKQVSICPADYARDALSGTLVAADEYRYIVRREAPEVGAVHVHLPTNGYELKPI